MVYADQARQAGDSIFGGKKNNLQTQTQMNNNAAQAMAGMLNQYGQTGAREIDASFQGLLGDMGRNQQAAMQVLNEQTGRVGQGYQDAAAANLAVRDEGRNYMSQLMGAIGMGGANAQAQAPLEQLAAQLNERNLRYGQDAQTSLGNWASQHNVLYGDQMVNARGRQAEAQTGFAAEIAKGLQQAEADRVKRELEFQQALSALLGEQSQFELGYANQMVDRDTRVAMQQAEMQQRAAEHAASLALQREKMAADERRANDPNSLEWAKFHHGVGQDAQSQRNWEAEFARDGIPDPATYSGVAGAKQWIQDHGLDSSFLDTVRNQLLPHINNPDVVDPYSSAVQAYRPPGQGAMSGYVRGSLPPGWNKTMPSQSQFADLAAIIMGQYQ